MSRLHMKYAYEDLSPNQFEALVIGICQFLLGAAVQGFATGPDGGRDAKFVGTAERHPSTTDPWKGTAIVQAKHTYGFNESFSDSSFFSDASKNTVLGRELPRIRKLRDEKGLDHYMLFSNRRLTGGCESRLRTHISKECGLAEFSIYLCGVEQLEIFLRRFPEAAKIANIDPIDSPLTITPDELAEIVESLASQFSSGATSWPAYPPTERVSYESKNQLNKMTPDYGKYLRRKYLKDTQQIKTFLSAPENDNLLRKYESMTEDFQLRILAKRKDYQTFDEAFMYLRDLVLSRDVLLRANKRLTTSVLFYMYWNCDIGLQDDAPAQQALTP